MPRWLEFIIALIGLIVISPLIAIIMLAIVLDSPGWPFFLQRRVGLGGQYFWMFKFRKMPSSVPPDGKGITTKNDIRLTRVGRYLERFKLDELPQLINVVLGTMSLVGPRPEIPRFTNHYSEKWRKVLSIRPGVIGYNQIKVPHETDLYPPDCMDHEKYYIENILPAKLDDEIEYLSKKSLKLDLYILFSVTLSLLTKTITWNWILIHISQLFILAADTLISCVSLYLSYLLVHQQLIMHEALYEDVRRIIYICLFTKPVIFMIFGLPKYSISSSITLKYLMTVMKASLYSCLAVTMILLFFFERDLVLSAHIVDAFLLPSLLIGARITYVLIHDWLLEMGSLQSWGRAVSHLLIVIFYGATGFLTFWISNILRRQELNINTLLPILWDVSLCALVIRGGLSIFMWPPKAKTWRSFFGREISNVLNVSLIGTGMILLSHFLLQNVQFSRSSLAIDFILFSIVSGFVSLIWCIPQIQNYQHQQSQKIMILGIGIETEMFLSTLHRLNRDNLKIVGVITDIEWKRFSSIEGYNVIGTISDVESLLEVYHPDLLITWERIAQKEFFPFIEKACKKYNVTISISPSIDSFMRASNQDATAGASSTVSSH